MTSSRAAANLLLLSLLWAPLALADKLTILPAAQTAPALMQAGPLGVQRELDNGTPTAPGTSLTVTLSSTSARGEFSLQPESHRTWTPSLSVTIAASQSTSAPFYYRDGNTSPATLTATASGLTSGTIQISFTPDSLAEDWELGTLLRSPGGFDRSSSPMPNITLEASTLGAHRGSQGFYQSDNDVTTGAGGGRSISYTLPEPVGNLYGRCWIRIDPTSTVGASQFMALGTNCCEYPRVEARVAQPGGTLRFGGFTSNGAGYVSDEASVAMSPGTWRLIELSMQGIGTAACGWRAWVDGKLESSRSFDCTGLYGGFYWLGLFWQDDRRWTGTLSADDCRYSTVPLASTLSTSAAKTALNANGCTGLTVSTIDSASGAAASAPYDVQAALSLTGVSGGFFSDASCTAATTSVTVPAGSTSAPVYVRPTSAGTASISATHLDFLPRAESVPVNPPLVINPAAPSTAPRATISFSAMGGSGSYTWSMASAPSGATIVSSSGAYTAGATGEVIDQVRVTDGLGYTETVQVSVGPGVTVAPSVSTVAPGEEIDFSASGGSGSFTWSLVSSPSGASVDPTSGVYVAGATDGVQDVVRATDTLGNAATATITVSATLPPDAGTPDAGVPADAGTPLDAGTPDAGEGSAGPVAILVAPPVVQAGGVALLDGSASLPSSGASLVEWRWTQVDGPAFVALQPSAAQDVTLEVPGRYGFELVVLDSAGNTSPPVRAEVRAQGETPVPGYAFSGCGCGASSTQPLLFMALALVLTASRRRSSAAR